MTALAGQVGVTGKTDGIGTAASFNNPCGITKMGNSLFIADSYNYAIRRIDLATGAVHTLVPLGTLNQPLAITNDGANLYVVDVNAIIKVW